MTIQDRFNNYLKRKGKDVTILHYDGTVTYNNAGDEIPAEPTLIPTKCRINQKQAYQEIQMGNVTISGTYALGLFSMDDAEYLKVDNQVIQITATGVNKYDIKVINDGEGHLEAILV